MVLYLEENCDRDRSLGTRCRKSLFVNHQANQSPPPRASPTPVINRGDTKGRLCYILSRAKFIIQLKKWGNLLAAKQVQGQVYGILGSWGKTNYLSGSVMTMDLQAEYDLDFYAWVNKNVELLRGGRLAEIDVEHIAEELESMGKRDLRQLRSRLQVLVMHLLKWQYQSEKQSKSWLATIQHQRDEIEALLMDSPSLREKLEPGLVMIYPKAVRDASRETGLPEKAFPLSCPFEVEEILEPSFLPD